MIRQKQLETLLKDLFVDNAELRRWLMGWPPFGVGGVDTLPAPVVDKETYTFEAVWRLSNAGLLGDAFFQRLLDEPLFAKRRGDIEACWARFIEAPRGDEAPSLAAGAHPPWLASALTLLRERATDWGDGGYNPLHHGCYAGTPPGAERAVRDRLTAIADLQAIAPNLNALQFMEQLRFQTRLLYGAVLRWFHLAQLRPPPELGPED